MSAEQISSKSRAVVQRRDAGYCILGGHPRAMATQIHHRKPRRMGGTREPSTNAPANLVSLCTPCHDWVESHRAAAMAIGLLLTDGQEPASTPVTWRGTMVLLDDEGGTTLWQR